MAGWEKTAADWAKTIIGAGIGTALVQPLLALYRDRRDRQAHAAYMAMRLAVVLEAYAAACSDFISENDAAETPHDEEYPDWSIILPPLSAYPDDAEGWRAVDRMLAGRCLNLRNKISGSQAVIYSIRDNSTDDLGDVLAAEAAARGLEAWKLATDLRRRHGIEEADAVWDVPGVLEYRLERARKAQDDSRQSNADVIRSMLNE